MIERAFHAYTTAVGAAFETIQYPLPTRGKLVELRHKKAAHLSILVDQLEKSHAFSALLEKTRSAFCGDWHTSKNESSGDRRSAIFPSYRLLYRYLRRLGCAV